MSEMDETLQIFFAETDDLLRSAEESLLRLESAPKPGPDVEEIFRAVHTLKSGSAMVGFPVISDYAHVLENLLERLRSGKLAISKPLISFLLSDVDFLRQMVDRGGQGKLEAEPDIIKSKKAQLNRFLGMEAIPGDEAKAQPAAPPKKKAPEKKAAEPSAPAAAIPAAAAGDLAGHWKFYQIDMKFREDLFRSGQDPILLILGLSEMVELVDVMPDISHLPPLGDMDPFSLYISWRLTVKSSASLEEIEDVFMFVKDDNDIHIEDITSRFKDGVEVIETEKPLGEVLLERGAISKEDLDLALGQQKRLGQILVESGKIDESTLEQVVSRQEESRRTYRKTSVRVDVEKINHLVNLAEEIGISLSRLRDMISKSALAHGSEMEQEMENLLKVNREFQERVSQIRMFPLEGTFRRFQRIARDTAFEQNKRIRVNLVGLDTELDKEVIEHITDPLKHLVRNSVDHGLETPAERDKAGKPPEGVIEFRAFQKGGMILIQISDDGRGMDVEKISARAIELGIIKPGQAVDDTNLLDIICRPGFSTAEQVSAISGRGVGMDVVRTEVERLGGTMTIDTVRGQGTTFTLSLPLTFALLEALHIKVCDRSFLVPLWGVAGTEKYIPAQARFFGAGQRVYSFRGEYVPLVDLVTVFGMDVHDQDRQSETLVFVNTSRQRFGMLVDQVLDPHQVVVKSLESNFKSVKGLSGATIMGDGSVALVMDLFALEEMFYQQPSRSKVQ
ncbi:MAG: chemotaxis protein CheA [Desulfatibacillaceae bacterium]|nr:chemotaxis protein CheA [Desulfatibacillaceae bacterium]